MIPLMRLEADPGDADTVERVATHLERGGLLAYPTETVYGLGARADEAGVRAVRELKGRDDPKPFLVLLPPGGAGDPYAGGSDGLEWTPQARSLAGRFWPGPLTLVLADPQGVFPRGIRGPGGGVAVRRSPHPFVEALLGRWPHSLISTSANLPGQPPARSADEVERAVQGRPGLDRLWILDGGPLVGSQVSTLVDCTGPRPRLLRKGALTARELRTEIPEMEGC